MSPIITMEDRIELTRDSTLKKKSNDVINKILKKLDGYHIYFFNALCARNNPHPPRPIYGTVLTGNYPDKDLGVKPGHLKRSTENLN